MISFVVVDIAIAALTPALASGRFEGFEDALATAAEDNAWSWTGTRALTAMKEMLSPRYSAIMSMSAYPEAKGDDTLPNCSSKTARAANAKARPRAIETTEHAQVHHTGPFVRMNITVLLQRCTGNTACEQQSVTPASMCRRRI